MKNIRHGEKESKRMTKRRLNVLQNGIPVDYLMTKILWNFRYEKKGWKNSHGYLFVRSQKLACKI